MGVFSKLAGKAIKGGTRSGLMGSGRTTSLRTLDEMPTSEATLKRREEGKTLFGTPRQRMEEPPSITEETPPTTDMPPITAAPLVDDAKTARMMMLQGKPIEAAPPITPIETTPIRAEIDVVPPVREEMDELMPTLTAQPGSETTQIATTIKSYKKAVEKGREDGPVGSVLDYGAGLGKGTDAM